MPFRTLVGDCLESLRTLPDCSVHCCITSPPYWGLRDYGHDGQIGLESSPEQFVAKLVEVFREVRRVLRDDGALWLNLGDSYAGSWGNYGGQNRGNGTQRDIVRGSDVPNPAYDGMEHFCPPTSKVAGLKPKDLVGVPWRVAFALQADGWWLRQDIIWAKPNPMPESVTDRCTKAHEYLFLLAKSERYYYDAEAIREPGAESSAKRLSQPTLAYQAGSSRVPGKTNGNMKAVGNGSTRNRRSVWTVATAPYSEAHFATYPPKLIEPCILAGTSEKGACSVCGAPWERVVEKTGQETSGNPRGQNAAHCPGRAVNGAELKVWRTRHVGWQPTCDCSVDVVPCVVLDPFGGSGTTAGVANALGRDAILCELNPEYAALMPDRVRSIVDDYFGRTAPSNTKPAKGQRALFA